MAFKVSLGDKSFHLGCVVCPGHFLVVVVIQEADWFALTEFLLSDIPHY